jgi:hypothetical protein
MTMLVLVRCRVSTGRIPYDDLLFISSQGSAGISSPSNAALLEPFHSWPVWTRDKLPDPGKHVIGRTVPMLM